jgi:hypothetical protein
VVIDFKNLNNYPCTLYGYPGISLASGKPVTQIGQAAVENPATPRQLVTLAPGGVANALLRIVRAADYPAARCAPVTFVTWPARGRVPGPAHPPVGLPQSASRRGRERIHGWPGRRRGEGWFRDQPVEVVEQREVLVRVEHGQQFCPRGGAHRREVTLYPGFHWPDSQFHGRPAQPGPQVSGQHLADAGLAEHAAEPLEVGGQPGRGVMAQNVAERAECGAQTPAGHPHLVHGIGLIQAHQRIQGHQRARLGP